MITPAELVAQAKASWEAEVSAKLAGLLIQNTPKIAHGYEPGAPDGKTVGDCSTEETRERQTLLTPDKTYFECQSCGAVVMSQYTHVQWHREMDERCGG